MGDTSVSADSPPIVARPPRQDRSRASFERMLSAAEALLIEHGSDDFALADVSRVGKVSIGSIYNRFVSKDELIRAVHSRVMKRIGFEQTKMIMRARSRGRSPVALVRAIIEELGELLATHASVMRPLMLRAAFDNRVQARGRATHEEFVALLITEILVHRDAINHRDPKRAVRGVILIAYAAFARELGFGMSEPPPGGLEWEEMKVDLSEMSVRFLFRDPSMTDSGDGASEGD